MQRRKYNFNTRRQETVCDVSPYSFHLQMPHTNSRARARVVRMIFRTNKPVCTKISRAHTYTNTMFGREASSLSSIVIRIGNDNARGGGASKRKAPIPRLGSQIAPQLEGLSSGNLVPAVRLVTASARSESATLKNARALIRAILIFVETRYLSSLKF